LPFLYVSPGLDQEGAEFPAPGFHLGRDFFDLPLNLPLLLFEGFRKGKGETDKLRL
jgi:hypothetical protein